MSRKSSNDPGSWTAKFVSLFSYGTLSYDNFTRLNYTVWYHKVMKDKIDPQYTKILYTVRVQAELIYTVLNAEGILKVDSYKIVNHFVPHSPEAVELERKLSWFPPFFPLEEFRDYFGEELAFVYAWSNFWWTFGLLPIALFGLITLLYGLGTEDLNPKPVFGEVSHFWRVFSDVVNNPSIDYYVGFLVVWISVFQYQWSKAAPIFSLQWGVANFHQEEELSVSIRKKFRKFVKLPNLLISLAGFLIAAALTCVLFVITEILIRANLNNLDFGVFDDKRMHKMINKTFIISQICSLVYAFLNHLAGSFFIPWLSDFLTSLENHKFRSFYSNSVIFKHTGYYLMSSYMVLLYLVFRVNVIIHVKYDIDLDAGEECYDGICTISIVEQIVTQVLELRLSGAIFALLKHLVAWVRQKKPIDTGSRDLAYILQNCKSLKFLDSAETSTWMVDRVLMYGYIALFSYQLPIVSLLALLVETFVTYFEMKMLLRSQRPQPRRVGNIKQWEGIIYLINIMCIIINSYSINQHIQNRKPDSSNPTQFMSTVGHMPFYFMPLFIFISSLIHIQDAVSGDKVQCHIHSQYQHAVRLLSENVVEVDGTKTTSL